MDLLQRLVDDAALLLPLVGVLGLFIGSFLNVVIYRVPVAMQREWHFEAECILHPDKDIPPPPPFNIMVPGSHCPHCQTPIKPWHNLPLVGYMLLGGKCAACQAPISLRYPMIELCTALLGMAAVYVLGPGVTTLGYIALVWTLLVLTMIDIDHQLLPDSITLGLLWGGLVFNALFDIVPLVDAVWGAVVGYLSLWSIYWAFKLLTGKEGMGYGDFKLLAALGAWLGWQALPLIIMLSSFVGATLGILAMLWLHRDRDQPIPFGPYLAIAGVIALLWGETLTQHYLRILS
ncbi:MAG: hypothetical protein RL336_922 [Pseudomonadota bacterium]|jgi:leader peptidase (prepilin peptidase)/N-methyltransferase